MHHTSICAPDAALVRAVLDEVLQVRHLFGPRECEVAVSEYFHLGFDVSYLNAYTAKEMASHAYGFMCAKAAAAAGEPFYFNGVGATCNGAFFFCKQTQPSQVHSMAQVEKFLEANQHLQPTHATSIRSYHSQNIAEGTVLITVEFCEFIDPSGTGGSFEKLTTQKFMRLRPESTRQRYEQIIRAAASSIRPAFHVEAAGDGVVSLKICVMPDRLSYMTTLCTLITSTIPGVMVMKKFCESFSNGLQVYTFYVRHATPPQLQGVAAKLSALPYAPGRPSTHLYNQGVITVDELLYCNAITMFAYYFTPPLGSEDFSALAMQMRHHPISLARLKKLRNELFTEVLHEEAIGKLISRQVALVKKLYVNFVEGPTAESAAELEKRLRHDLRGRSQLELQVFLTFLTFNRSVVKTNFFKPQKSAVSFRFDPAFIATLDFPRVPYGIFMVLGAQFRGFHVRFNDISRGGVRLVLSRTVPAYVRNKQSLFNENYNLALAQHLKNKDIPEGGSKGIILTSMRARLKPRTIFLQYVDALLDLIIPDVPDVRSSLRGPEVLFLGPDENTAGAFPALAALHSKSRGYKQWKSFTTGKSPELGGIPHDKYGMTSNGVRTFVDCMYKKLGLDPSRLTKFQTGGPDGDLGSNEIKLANERYIGLVDGSGSLYDPEGLHGEELRRIAGRRDPLRAFNTALLSPRGFFVPVESKMQTLPDGTIVEDGEQFRNTFHLSAYAVADTFIPCGGRPASVNIDNVHHFLLRAPAGTTGQQMLEGALGNLAGTDKLRFKYIVEGANLFITHDARLALENVGVVLIKDSSANKAGVTCSSLEVVAGLATTDEEHKAMMCVSPDGVTPAFYEAYVREVIEILWRNAEREFDCLWRERASGALGGKITLISDAISSKIVDIRRFVSESDLYDDQPLVRHVLRNYFPKTLQQQVPLETLLDRVPKAYLRAIFAIWIASDFVYATGLHASEFSFFQYMSRISKEAHGNGKGATAKL